ncbi:MAG: hypothetical protein ACR2PG_26775 [Hyphomicrobiaceae bacterium]
MKLSLIVMFILLAVAAYAFNHLVTVGPDPVTASTYRGSMALVLLFSGLVLTVLWWIDPGETDEKR